jgi:F-type H+-transporting ATPase subunit a
MGKEQVLGWTKVVNAAFGKPVAALLMWLHIRPENPEYPIPNHIAMELLVFAFAVLFFLWLRGRIRADRPGATQQVMELLLVNPMGVGIRDLLEDIVGHGSEQHIPLIGTVALFIFFSNMLAVVPGLMSPTAAVTVPLGCAVVVFIYYNRFGLKKHGVGGYAKTLLGPVPAISPIMFVVETFSHFARLLSLTVRLWANMMVSELIFVSFLGLSIGLFTFLGHRNAAGYASAIVPVGIPLALTFFHIFEAVLQAFIFTILSIVYLGLATAEEH